MKSKSSNYERITQKLLSGLSNVKTKPFCKFVGHKFHIGTQSNHKTEPARRARLFWRMKNSYK